MPQLTLRSTVRLYYGDSNTYDDVPYDEGVVVKIDGDAVEIDFYDWIERWERAEDFQIVDLWLEGKMIFVPLKRGTITTEFRHPALSQHAA